MKTKKVKNRVCRLLSAIVAFVFFFNSFITDYAFSLQVPSQIGNVVLQEAAKDLYGLSMLKRKIEETRKSCDSIGDFYFTIAFKLGDILHCQADLLVRKEGKVVTPRELESQLAGLDPADRIQRVNNVVDEILIRLSNRDIILRYCNSAANVPDLDNAISVGENLHMKGQRKSLAWDTYYTKEFAERTKAAVGTREVKEVAEELAQPLLTPETAPAVAHPEEVERAPFNLIIWLTKALRASIAPIVILVLIAGYKLLAGDTADHNDYIGPAAGIGPVVLAGILLDQARIRLAGFREWVTGKKGRPGEGYQKRRLALETLEDKQLLSAVAPVDLSSYIINDTIPAMAGPLTAGQGAGGQMIANTMAVDHAVTGLYSEGEAGPRAESDVHSEWHVTVGTTTTYLTLDFRQFAMSWNGNTYVYHRDIDMVSYDTSQDAGFVFSRRGYGKFTAAMNDMARNLRIIGENGLADRLISGELYNYQQVMTPTPGITIQIDAERSIYFSTYNEWRITESATNRTSDTVNLDGAISHYEVSNRCSTTRIEYDRNGTYVRGNIDNRAFEFGFDRFDDYVKEIFRIRRLMYSWRDEIAKDPERAETARLLDLAIVEFYHRMPAQKTATYYYGTGGVLGVRALANGEIQRPADSRYYQGSLEGQQYWFDSIKPESLVSDGSRVTAKVIEVGIGQSLPPIFKWEDEVLTPETGFNGIARPNDEQLREYLIRLDRVMELFYRLQGDISHVVKPSPQSIQDQLQALRQRVYGAFAKAGITLPEAAVYTPGRENEYTIYRPNGDLETWKVQKVVLQEGVTYRFELKSRFAITRLDVNRDGFVTPIDALIVINFINERGTGVPDGVVDVNEDGFVTPIDVLQIINYFNNRPAAGETAAQVSAEGEAYINEINRTIPELPPDAQMKAKWDGRKQQIVIDLSAGPKDERIATVFITRAPVREEAGRPRPPQAEPAAAEDSVSMTKEACERLQAGGKVEATTAEIMGTLALILGERELKEAEAAGLPFQKGAKPDADRLKTIFRSDPNDNPILVKIAVEALQNLTIGEVNERFGPYRAIGNLHIRLFSMQRPDEVIARREVYEKYGLEDSMDKACLITDETSSKKNTITLWCSDTDNDLTETDIREYIEKTVQEYRSWLCVFGLRDTGELNMIGPQLFIDMATSIDVNKVFRVLKLLIRLTPIRRFDISVLRQLRDALAALEAAA
ncbi:MAG: dockerin type I domain-containing protein [Candidatus Omnitrophota bacterium]|nr:dockerin type I domain-containing protein [Candidatus Omnitrophota bacterium]